MTDRLEQIKANAIRGWRGYIVDPEDWDWLIQELEQSRAEVEDWREYQKTVMDTAADDHLEHCTCVPGLRAEVERLKQFVGSVRAVYPHFKDPLGGDE
jgi:hypothetical protein